MEILPVKRLGFGMMRLPRRDPNNASDVDVEQVKKMVDLFLEKGFTYFDTAWMYNAFTSERVVKEALTSRHPRESFTLATKLHGGFVNSPEDRDKIFNTQLEKTGAGYFDYYLVHGVDRDLLKKCEQYDLFGYVLQKKKEGLVRHAGFSFHDSAEILDDLLSRYPEMEFVQLQINYLDWENEWIQSKACYDVAVKHGKPVIVMEPVKGGTLANLPEEAEKLFREQDPSKSIPSWAIRFVAGLENVMVVLSGMSSLEQMEDNISFMQDFVPLNEKETELCHKAAEIINGQIAVPCTACHYCTDGCPMKICIPEYFSIYNADLREDLAKKGWTVSFSTYGLLSKENGKASDCIGCGQCESVCPQHLPIIRLLQDVSSHYEK